MYLATQYGNGTGNISCCASCFHSVTIGNLMSEWLPWKTKHLTIIQQSLTLIPVILHLSYVTQTIFPLSVIYENWSLAVCLCYIFDIMVANDLVTQGPCRNQQQLCGRSHIGRFVFQLHSCLQSQSYAMHVGKCCECGLNRNLKFDHAFCNI